MNKSGNVESLQMDWQLNRSLSECATNLYMNEHLSDVTIVLTSANPPIRLPAHRFLLAIRSPVFEAMFYGALKAVEVEVALSDVPVDGFLAFLRFLYTDVAVIESDTLMECLQVGHMYRVHGFVKKCEAILMKSIDATNALPILETSIIFNLQILKAQCMKYIEINAVSVVKSKAFLSLSKERLTMIVGESGLQAPELDIYMAVNSWASKACELGSVPPSHENKRKFLGDAFSKLRLGHIPQSDFASVVVKENLLSKDEMLMYFRLHHDTTVSKLDFAENAVRAPSLDISLPTKLSHFSLPAVTHYFFMKTCITFNRGVNFVGINISENINRFVSHSWICHVQLLKEDARFSSESIFSSRAYTCVTSTARNLEIDRYERAGPAEGTVDVLFDTAFLLELNARYILTMYIARSAVLSQHDACLNSWKVCKDNMPQHTADGKTFTRHHCQLETPDQSVNIKSLLILDPD